MKKLLLLGAGRSASILIDYLLEHSPAHQWQLIVADREQALAEQKTHQHPHATAIAFDVRNEVQAKREVKRADLVISMLPVQLHIGIARLCLTYGKPLITASYVSPEMQALDAEARRKGLLFLNECGLDPGIDHLSAMQVIDDLKAADAQLYLFKSFAGGLVAPPYDNNPWHYKFTWNPRNVVLAGQGTALFREQGIERYVPYHQIFKSTENFYIEEVGSLEGYPNRNSLTYAPIYGLENIPTIQRGTLRYDGFCAAWDALVHLGLTEDHYTISDSATLSYRDFFGRFLPVGFPDASTALCAALQITPQSPVFMAIAWLGLLDSEQVIGLEQASPAQILQQLLEEKWKLDPNDKDMIVMQHQFGYHLRGRDFLRSDSLVVYGEDTQRTAMAKTVGLPIGVAVRLLLTGQLQGLSGVMRPVIPEIYRPMLKELATLGLVFKHHTEALLPENV
ncbi:MAG: saccharopine dehydrogenase C-terminal domain-containing protein [Bernardetiaceae bacterium]